MQWAGWGERPRRWRPRREGSEAQQPALACCSKPTRLLAGKEGTEAHRGGAPALVNGPTKPVAVVESSHEVGSGARFWLYPFPYKSPLRPHGPRLIEMGYQTVRQTLSFGCHEDALGHIWAEVLFESVLSELSLKSVWLFSGQQWNQQQRRNAVLGRRPREIQVITETQPPQTHISACIHHDRGWEVDHAT